MLAALPREQVRALYPSASAFPDRTGLGPRRPTELRDLLREVRARGYATEDSEVADGLRSVGAVVRDHAGWPVAAVAVTWADEGLEERVLADAVIETAGGAGVPSEAVSESCRRACDISATRSRHRLDTLESMTTAARIASSASPPSPSRLTLGLAGLPGPDRLRSDRRTEAPKPTAVPTLPDAPASTAATVPGYDVGQFPPVPLFVLPDLSLLDSSAVRVRDRGQ